VRQKKEKSIYTNGYRDRRRRGRDCLNNLLKKWMEPDDATDE
jgi:hypothetical protein